MSWHSRARALTAHGDFSVHRALSKTVPSSESFQLVCLSFPSTSDQTQPFYFEDQLTLFIESQALMI